MKEKNKKKPFITDTLSLFLSCSVSLILISLFILIDAKNIGLDSKSSQRGMFVGDEVEEDSLKVSKKNFSCFEFEVDHSLKYLHLPEEKIAKLEDLLKDSDLPIPEDIIDYLKRRAACGYVSTNINLVFKIDPVKDPGSYERYIKAFVQLKRSLEEISKDLVLEVVLEEV